MSYQLRLAGPAKRYLDRLPLPVQERVLTRLEQIADDPYDSRHTKPLQGPGSRRSARRIVFNVDRDQQLVDVSDIGPRGQIYRRL